MSHVAILYHNSFDVSGPVMQPTGGDSRFSTRQWPISPSIPIILVYFLVDSSPSFTTVIANKLLSHFIHYKR